MNTNYLELDNIIRNCKNIVIAGHTNPDGDCIGACLALGTALKEAGKEVKVILEPFSGKYNVIPGRELITHTPEDCQIDIFIALDCGNKDRLSIAAFLFDKAPVTINIDHHKSNTNFALINHVDSNASATCEILYAIIKRHFSINREIATSLYAGIVYDTGGFRHASTSEKTFNIISSLISYKIPFDTIYTSLINRHSVTEAKLLAKAINNMEIFPNYIISSLTVEEIDEVNGNSLMLDGVVGFLIDTENVRLAVFLYEKEKGIVKISLRSVGNIDVSKIAGLFSGGGHINAAGATFNGSITQAKEKIISLIEETIS